MLMNQNFLFLDEEFHDGAPIYATSSMKAFIEKHGAVSKDQIEKENPRASSRQVAGDTFKAVPMEAGAGAEMTQV